jgi:tryptophan-rich sensory protein
MPLPDKSLPFNEWYDLLIKPSWTPDVRVIGVIWGILYPIIAVVYGYSIYQVFQGKWPKYLLVPILLNVLCNALFTPVQFGLRNFILASVIVVAVFLTAVWSIIVLYKFSPALAAALIPYAVWTLIASVLQISLTILNW